MPSSMSIYLKGDPEKKHGYYLASLLHGALMERIDPSYAEALHRSDLHPYSQYVREKDGTLIWTVNSLNDDADRYICDRLQEDAFDSIKLEHRDETLIVMKKEKKAVSYRTLVEKYYLEPGDRMMKIRFVTPTSFKQNGEYCLFPSERLIFQSLMRKFDACSEDNSVYSEEILGHYEKYARIVGYNLRSTQFHMEGVRIPSFMGTVTIRIGGPQQMANMARMLVEFGTYSGVGIKCGIGMGAMVIEDIKNTGKKG